LRYELDRKNTIPITSLHNSRNINFEDLYILNVVEGILPDKKRAQFLLSENQRKKLGLKTYEDITLRDKYYFYRLLTSSRQVTIFTRNDLEENIEISSFLEELKLHDLLEEPVNLGTSKLYKNLFYTLFEEKFSNLKDDNVSEKFFSFPAKKDDFPDIFQIPEKQN